MSQVAVYGIAAADYARAGWTCVLPIPAGQKFPPPDGFTGEHGADTSPEQIADWAGLRPDSSIALRMPRGVIGLDVDHYVKGAVTKSGNDTLAEREAELGPLPLTYSSTARGSDTEPGPSRIMFFRVPDQRYITKLPDIEIIQHHHRYALVAPSPHGEGGTYRWYAPDGQPLGPGMVPRPDQLAELPPAWVQYLAEGAAAAGPVAADKASAQALLSFLLNDQRGGCIDMERAMSDARQALSGADQGSRHDTMIELTYRVIQLGAEGHHGASHALLELMAAWDAMTAGEDREYEFTEMCEGAAAKAVTKISAAQPVSYDPCLLMNMGVYQAPVPDLADDDPEPAPVAPPRQWSPFEAIGTGPFEPAGELDATLARDVLARTWPVLRFAPDAGAWIVRGPDRWDVRKGELGKWGVDLVSWLMLPGDPDAPEGSDDWRRAKKRARFCTSASSNAIAQKMSAQLAAGHHPSAVELAELDGEREILWAGGWPYDLRACLDGPAFAQGYDPGTPHLHSAGVIPDITVPTPLWDAFLAAVWPDNDLRAWALRVLSVAFTGHPDKALPILLGDTDRGKTQVIMLLMSVLGSYGHVADARLLAPADKSHASIVYALKGRRLSFIDEAPRTGQLATERLKQITGGAELTGNRMSENPVTFKPTHTLILTANPEHEPVLTDAAIRRRVRLIPCNGDPAEVIRIRSLIGAEHGSAWMTEAPGVLAKMMREAALWLADPGSAGNQSAPGSAAEAAHEIMVSQDLVMSWLREECEDWEPGTRSRELFTAFTESCRRMAINPAAIPSETKWGRRLTELGYPPLSRNDANYRHLRVRPPQIFGLTPADLSGATGGSAGPGGGLRASSGGLVEGFTPPAEPSTNGNGAGQTIHQTIHVEGVEGKNKTTTHTHAHTRTRTQGGKGSTLHTLQPSTEPASESPPDAETAEPAKSSRKVTKAKTGKPKPDPELEGPVHQLPVIVARNPEAPDALPLVLPCSPADARTAVQEDLAALSVDCETTGYPPGHPAYALRTVQLGGEQMAAVLDPADPEQAAVITDLLSRADRLHAHSAAADLVPLAHAGLADAEAMWAKMEDSVLITKLGDPGLAGSDENELKRLAGALLGPAAVSPPAERAKNALFKSGGWLVQTTALTPPEKSGWAQVKSGCETMARYAGSDVLDLGAVIRALPRPDEAILTREREFQAMCARVAHQGFRLDPDHIAAKIAEFTAAREAARERVHAACPAITNPSSTKEVPEALAAMGVPLGITPGGKPSAAKTELELLAGDPGYEHAQLLRDILEYRHDVTTLGLLLEPLNVLCQHGDGRMRPVVYTINADTGRTSCVRPNGQQFSRQGGIRACVIADGDMLGISADFSGVEIRVAAALSGDMDLLRAELDGTDHEDCADHRHGLHWMAAKMAWGPGATKENRYAAKRIIFSKLFGGSAKAGARQTGVSHDAALAVHRAFEQIAPGYAEWDRRMRAYADAGNRGYRAYSGRVIWLPKGRSHAAGNYAIQGTARELLVDGALRWHRTQWGRYPLLPIHDELLTFVPAGEAIEALGTLQACMRNQHFYEQFGVPIEAAADAPFTAWPDSS